MKTAKRIALLPSLLFFAVIATASARGLDLVRDGQPRAEIVVDRDAHSGIQLAARDLQEHLEKISGVRLELVHAPSGAAVNPVYVGESEHTVKLGYQLPEFSGSGYDILVGETYAVLSGPNTFYPPRKFRDLAEFQKFMGEQYTDSFFGPGSGSFNEALDIYDNDDIGAWYAVSALLERLGVRFYAPYEDGTIFPERKTIALDPGRETRQAAFDRRQWTYYGKMKEDREGVAWLKRLKCGTRTGIICNHTTRNLIGDPETRLRHPSWYAEESPGKLFDGFRKQGGVPRYTDPDFQRACVDWARKLFDTYPMLSQVTLGAPEDSGDPYDWRDKKVYQKPGMSHKQAYANMMWDFHAAIARELKETHPEKGLIWWCLYNNNIPTNIDPMTQPDNILCRMEAVPPTAYVLDEQREEFFNGIRAMFAAFKPRGKSQQWEWWLDYSWPTSPRYPQFFMRKLQQARQEQRHYFDGFFMEVTPDPRMARIGEVPISHLMLYVNCKLLWDPELDLDALLDEYYKLWFGPAEKEMKAFHEFAEKVWCRPGSRSVSDVNGFLRRTDVPRYFELLDAAKARTQPGTVYFNRIAAMEQGYAGLKTIFDDRTPRGPSVQAVTLPNDARADGDFSKYEDAWQTLPGAETGRPVEQNKTEFAVGLSADKKLLLVAVRCYEETMDRLVEKTKVFDTKSVFSDDHVEIHLNSPEKNYFTVAVNPALAIWDECRDIEIINRDALPVLWTPGTKAHVKKLADRWELEVSIPTDDFGRYGPKRNVPWGFNLRRVRMAGGKAEEQALTPLKPSQWMRLSQNVMQREKSDLEQSANRYGFIVRPAPQIPADYTVRKASGPVKLSEEWSSPTWGKIVPLKLETELFRPGVSSGHLPDTQIKMQYDDQFLYGLFQVKDCYVRAMARRDQEQVCLDSCVEFYVKPVGSDHFFNFEFNCGGVLLLYDIVSFQSGDYEEVSEDELNTIERFHTLPRRVDPEITSPVTWRLGFKIPLDFFVQRSGVRLPLSGQVWTANFTKCADWTSHPHWLSWRAVQDFPCTEEFGNLIFE